MGEMPRVVAESGAVSGMRVIGLDHVVLWSADVERSVAFYRDVLGCAVERYDEWRAGSVPFPSVRISDSTLVDVFPGGGEDAGRQEPRNMHHFCLVVQCDDMADLLASLKARGVKALDEVATRWGARGDGSSIYIRDPDGNVIELKSY
jgi:catechol 2,3-dioxygenase-like lactoylglutathione lyase family enzyme